MLCRILIRQAVGKRGVSTRAVSFNALMRRVVAKQSAAILCGSLKECSTGTVAGSWVGFSTTVQQVR